MAAVSVVLLALFVGAVSNVRARGDMKFGYSVYWTNIYSDEYPSSLYYPEDALGEPDAYYASMNAAFAHGHVFECIMMPTFCSGSIWILGCGGGQYGSIMYVYVSTDNYNWHLVDTLWWESGPELYWKYTSDYNDGYIYVLLCVMHTSSSYMDSAYVDSVCAESWF